MNFYEKLSKLYGDKVNVSKLEEMALDIFPWLLEKPEKYQNEVIEALVKAASAKNDPNAGTIVN